MLVFSTGFVNYCPPLTFTLVKTETVIELWSGIVAIEAYLQFERTVLC